MTVVLVILLTGTLNFAVNVQGVETAPTYHSRSVDHFPLLDPVPPIEHHISVPYWSQINSYYCGPASLQMIFDYYGENIPQTEIAEVAKTVSPGTFTVGMIRAAHFSNQSTSAGTEMLNNITGYTLRTLGYVALETSGLTIEQLKVIVGSDYPTIALMYTVPDGFGHFRVVTGYDADYIYTNDPWKFGGGFGGKDYKLSYSDFDQLWDYSGHWAMVAFPWFVSLNVPANIYPGIEFPVTANITYPQPPIFQPNLGASAFKTTIILPAGVQLTPGENLTKPLPDIQPGTNAQVSWTLKATEPGNFMINVQAEANITGFDPLQPSPQQYTDRIGGENTSSIIALGPDGHDIEISQLLVSKNVVPKGVPAEANVKINVTARNRSNYQETFNLSVQANSGQIFGQNLTLAAWSNIELSCVFDTNGLEYGIYPIVAKAGTVQGETNTTNNQLTSHVTVSKLGDINGDFVIDIIDVVMVAGHFGTSKGDQHYDPIADVYNDEVIDILDIVIVVSTFGWTRA